MEGTEWYQGTAAGGGFETLNWIGRSDAGARRGRAGIYVSPAGRHALSVQRPRPTRFAPACFLSVTGPGGADDRGDRISPRQNLITVGRSYRVVDGSTVEEEFHYEFEDGRTARSGRLAAVTQRRRTDGGPWTPDAARPNTPITVSLEDHGLPNDLKTVDAVRIRRRRVADAGRPPTIATGPRTAPAAPGAPAVPAVPARAPGPGWTHGLKYRGRPGGVRPPRRGGGRSAGRRRRRSSLGYADHYFEYDDDRRVTKEIVAGRQPAPPRSPTTTTRLHVSADPAGSSTPGSAARPRRGRTVPSCWSIATSAARRCSDVERAVRRRRTPTSGSPVHRFNSAHGRVGSGGEPLRDVGGYRRTRWPDLVGFDPADRRRDPSAGRPTGLISVTDYYPAAGLAQRRGGCSPAAVKQGTGGAPQPQRALAVRRSHRCRTHGAARCRKETVLSRGERDRSRSSPTHARTYPPRHGAGRPPRSPPRCRPCPRRRAEPARPTRSDDSATTPTAAIPPGTGTPAARSACGKYDPYPPGR